MQGPVIDDLHCEDIGVVHGPAVTITSELHHHMYMFAMLPIMTGIMFVLILVNAVLFILLCIPEIGYRIGESSQCIYRALSITDMYHVNVKLK